MKVIGYVRVSTEEQASAGVSLADQLQKITHYAATYDLEIVETIEDAGHSAKSLNRPGIQRALEMLRTGQAEGLIIVKLDRLTRSVIDLNTLLSDYFTEKARYPVSLFSVTDRVDTMSANGRMMLNMIMTISQWEREIIGERTKAALQYKKTQGVKLGGPAGTRTPAEEKHAALNRMAELRNTGRTLPEIANTLNSEGYKTFRRGKTKGTESKWYASTVSYLLKNVIPSMLPA